MRSLKTALFFGFLNWLLPFVVAFVIFPLKEAGQPLFETIMPVTLTLCAVFFGCRYFRKVDRRFIAEGLKLGTIWFMVSLLIDLLMFMWGPMKMPFIDYMFDIGFTYLIFPIVTAGYGYILEKK